MQITIADRDDTATHPEAEKIKSLRLAMETIMQEYQNLDDVDYEHDSASSFMTDRLEAAIARHDRCWNTEGEVIPA